jgi:hypothetical protein
MQAFGNVKTRYIRSIHLQKLRVMNIEGMESGINAKSKSGSNIWFKSGSNLNQNLVQISGNDI